MDEEDLITAADGNIRGQVYCDVYDVPVLSDEKLIEGHYHDSYHAKVVGISDNQPDWMGSHDILLVATHQAVAAYTEPYVGWKGVFKDAFGKTRQRYNVNDIPCHKVGKENLTHREFDFMAKGTKCKKCGITTELVPREEVVLQANCKAWRCKDCK